MIDEVTNGEDSGDVLRKAVSEVARLEETIRFKNFLLKAEPRVLEDGLLSPLLPIHATQAYLSVFQDVLDELADTEDKQQLAFLLNIEKKDALTQLKKQISGDPEIPDNLWQYDPQSNAFSDLTPEEICKFTEKDGRSAVKYAMKMFDAFSKLGARLRQQNFLYGHTPDPTAEGRYKGFATEVSTFLDELSELDTASPDELHTAAHTAVFNLAAAKRELLFYENLAERVRAKLTSTAKKWGLDIQETSSLEGTVEQVCAGDIIKSPKKTKEILYKKIKDLEQSLPDKVSLIGPEIACSKYQTVYRSTIGDESSVEVLAEAYISLLNDHLSLVEAINRKSISKQSKKVLKDFKSIYSTYPKALGAIDELTAMQKTIEKNAKKDLDKKISFVKKYRTLLEEHNSYPDVVNRDEKGIRTACRKVQSLLEEATECFECSDVQYQNLEEQNQEFKAKLNVENPSEHIKTLVKYCKVIGTDSHGFRVADEESVSVDSDAASFFKDTASQTILLSDALLSKEISGANDEQVQQLEAKLTELRPSVEEKSAEFEQEVSKFLSKYSSSKRYGIVDLDQAIARLEEINSLKRYKKPHLNKHLLSEYQDKVIPKTELRTAKKLAQMREELEKASEPLHNIQEQIKQRKNELYENVINEYEELQGRKKHVVSVLQVEGIDDFDELCDYINKTLKKASELRDQAQKAKATYQKGLKLAELFCRSEYNVRLPESQEREVLQAVKNCIDDLAEDTEGFETAKKEYATKASKVLKKCPSNYEAAFKVVDSAKKKIDSISALKEGAVIVEYRSNFSSYAKSAAEFKRYLKSETKKAEKFLKTVQTYNKSIEDMLGLSD